MSASRAFDLALFVGTPANVNDASVVAGTKAAPFTTTFQVCRLKLQACEASTAPDLRHARQAVESKADHALRRWPELFACGS